MKIKFGQDMVTGLMFALIGAGALWIGKNYNMGTASQPGTGVLPAMLSCGLIAIGAALCLRSAISGDTVIERSAWGPVLWVTIATVAFGLLIDRIGFIPTTIVSLTLCALGTAETRWGEFAMFLGIMIATGWATFLWLLGMPIPAFAFHW